VPALEGTFDETDYRINAVRTGPPQQGTVSNDALPSVLPNTTATANVVIPIEVTDANFQVSGVDNQTITEGENATVTATVENVGGNLGSTQTIELIVDGTVVASQEQTIGANDTATVTLEGDTSDLSAGQYALNVASEDDDQSATLTVEANSNGDNGVIAEYDTNDNGVIEITELGVAAGDYANDELTITELGVLAGNYANNSS
jgi:archaellum component FlaF (FlaF/FlaG flagellin family)